MGIERVCVVGGGVIGGLYAAHLARLVDVAVLTRRAEQARALNERGLRVTGKSDFVTNVTASDDPAGLPDADLVIVATKATQLADAARSLGGRFAGATVMTIQNGLGAEELVRGHGDWPLVSAVTFMSGVRHGDAHVEYELDTETWLGPYVPSGTSVESVHDVAELLAASGLRARAFDDLRPAQWSKLIFNATVNSVAAVTNLPHVSQFASLERPTDLGHLVRELMDEGKRVAAAAGIALHEDPWEMNELAVRRGETEAAQGRYAHVPSMLEDVRAGRPTEVDFITGALVREGDRLGVPVPLQTAMYRLVKAREAAAQPPVREGREAEGVRGNREVSRRVREGAVAEESR